MKKVILALALVSGLSLASHAQNSNPSAGGGSFKEQNQNLPPDQRAAKEAARAERDLGLNADQKAKWQAAALDRANANESLRGKMKGSTTPDERTQARTQMKANNEKFDNEVNGFLTPDQKARYEQQKAQRHGKRGGGGMNHSGN